MVTLDLDANQLQQLQAQEVLGFMEQATPSPAWY
jgi:hypothetical protein